MNKHILLIFIILLILSCSKKEEKFDDLSPLEINNIIEKMTDIMVHDITNPPLASRFYAYSCLAGYEVIALEDTTYNSMHLVIKDFPKIQKPSGISGYSVNLSAILSIIETAKNLQPSGVILEEYQQNLLDSCRRLGFSEEIIQNSSQYAVKISLQLLAYAKEDGYRTISNYPRYDPEVGEGFWYPTPPGFFGAVEPHFNKVRPMFMDSASQFKPLPPAQFSLNKNSTFFKLMKEVYEEGLNASVVHKEIASFWDCNPFALEDKGHLMVGMKKISPGGHWMGITGIAAKKKNLTFSESLKLHTMISLGLFESFISCWDEKYRSNRIRPETAIRKYIDPDWMPLLQTPPFPEYPSGHSTVSAASSIILKHYLGENFSYIDSVEVKYGLPAKSFSSFSEAANEAAISRFYGGIHFKDANEAGISQGTKIARFILSRMENENPEIKTAIK